jgi:hypothetical protein
MFFPNENKMSDGGPAMAVNPSELCFHFILAAQRPAVGLIGWFLFSSLFPIQGRCGRF